MFCSAALWRKLDEEAFYSAAILTFWKESEDRLTEDKDFSKLLKSGATVLPRAFSFPTEFGPNIVGRISIYYLELSTISSATN